MGYSNRRREMHPFVRDANSLEGHTCLFRTGAAPAGQKHLEANTNQTCRSGLSSGACRTPQWLLRLTNGEKR